MSNLIDIIEKEGLRTDLPEFRVGDTVKINLKFKEITKATSSGSKNIRVDKTVKEEIKTQAFEGTVIARKNSGIRETITVRKIAAAGIGVEKTFQLNSPSISSIEITRKGRVRRAKLFYLRERTGKSARVASAKLVVVKKAD
ncbi:MAG: 50S ribosomal protein L19 [Clostridia bacterium]|nr:50S ribosomal protein L19 [Clostridia bacterium]